MSKIPVVDICGKEISRLIIGGNTISGTSHVDRQHDEEMENYFTTDKVKEMLFHCEECGIKSMQLRSDKHIMRIIREYRLDGGKMNWIAQSIPELKSFDQNVSQMASLKPALIYQHGVQADTLYKQGDIDELVRHLKVIRKSGYPVGLCTHMPEVMEYAETHKWDFDFYMSCVFNISDPSKAAEAKRLGNEDPLYDEKDVPLMYEAIKGVKKPVLAFKILAGSRRCGSQERVRAAFDEAFANIKNTDCVVVGMFPKYSDQIQLNTTYAIEAIQKAKNQVK